MVVNSTKSMADKRGAVVSDTKIECLWESGFAAIYEVSMKRGRIVNITSIHANGNEFNNKLENALSNHVAMQGSVISLSYLVFDDNFTTVWFDTATGSGQRMTQSRSPLFYLDGKKLFSDTPFQSKEDITCTFESL